MYTFDRWRIAFAVLVLASTRCSSTETTQPDGRDEALKVFTTFYPTTYFAHRIGGDAIDIVCPLPADADPVFWIPPADVLDEIQQADMIVINGAGFERWTSKVSLPYAKIVDTSDSFADELLRYKQAVTHSHGPGGEHSHEGIDGHIWLDPQLAKKQAEAIYRRLAQLRPEQAPQFQANFVALTADLDDLDQAMRELSGRLEQESLFASHPSYNYLFGRYGGKITNFALDGETMPDDETLAQLKALAKKQQVRMILWEHTPQAEIATRLQEELGIKGIVFQPCEHPPTTAGEDYLSVMKQNIATLEKEL